MIGERKSFQKFTELAGSEHGSAGMTVPDIKKMRTLEIASNVKIFHLALNLNTHASSHNRLANGIFRPSGRS